MLKNLFVVASIVGLSSVAQARPIPEVQDFLKEQLTRLAEVPQPIDQAHQTYSPMGDFALSSFRLRIQAELGFDVEFGKITLVPVAELFWE